MKKVILTMLLSLGMLASISAKDLVHIRVEEASNKSASWIKILDIGESRVIQLTGFNSDKDKTQNMKTLNEVLKSYLDQ